MIDRNITLSFTAALAAAALLIAAADTANAARASRGPGTGATIGTPITQPGHSSPNWGWGYGRGWCYWHPYVCYRNRY